MVTAPNTPTAEDFRACMAGAPRIVHTASGPVEYAERGHGEAILSVHGSQGGWDQGLVAGEYLRLNGFRIIAPSRPGYLGTPLSAGRTFAQQADALAALLDALQIDRVIVIAVSGGGPAGYELAAKHGERISRLVQVDAVCLTDRGPSRIAQLAAQDFLLEAVIWLLRRATKPTLTALMRSFGTYTRQAASERAAMLAALPGRTSWLEATLAASLGVARRRQGMKNDFTPGHPVPLDAIACPTLIVHGRLDKVVPPTQAEHAHAHITGSELYWMDGSHLAFALEAADTAPAYVANWLRDSR
ncbi:alpha/beta fold hydrolase [Ornithinimicrobium cerasi]|uniref:alpha/beta fold hydrolase n=1 Tax=Ornithinimicrobium cerasi TaxID=2248773 RepID=UPI000EFE2D7A|nr:alpha/beta hydrolase [Ornithinimicrobium cerasi]